MSGVGADGSPYGTAELSPEEVSVSQRRHGPRTYQYWPTWATHQPLSNQRRGDRTRIATRQPMSTNGESASTFPLQAGSKAHQGHRLGWLRQGRGPFVAYQVRVVSRTTGPDPASLTALTATVIRTPLRFDRMTIRVLRVGFHLSELTRTS